jgi:subtilase family serine protease
MLKTGNHTVNVTFYTSKQVIELAEINNTKSITFSTVAPDLIIKSISWSPSAAAGDNITITIKVENQGNFKANKSRLALSINGSPVQYSEIEEINMGATVTKDFSWNAVASSHEITAYADIDGQLQENNEINNTKSRTISLSEPKAPDNEPPIKISPVSSEDKGFIGNFWWLFLLVATLLGVGAFVLALKSFKKD